LTLELVKIVRRGTDNLPANFGIYATFHCRVMGKHFASVLQRCWLGDRKSNPAHKKLGVGLLVVTI